MKKELKQQIKQDELVHAYEASASWYQTHRSQTIRTLEIAGVVLVVAVGVGLYLSYRRDRAERDLREALVVFHGRVATETTGSNEPGAGPTFATPEQKYQRAAESFQKAADAHGGAAGQRARYYVALSKLHLGQVGEAEKILQDVAREADGMQQDLARMALAEAHLQGKQLDKAVDELKKLAEDPNLALPREHALMRLGEVLEQARRVDEAARSYRRVTDEFPDGAYVTEALRRLESLGRASG